MSGSPWGRALLEYAEGRGWQVVRRTGSGHLLMRCPCGQHTVTLAQSPSDFRGTRNAQAQVRRACRAELRSP